MINLSLVDETKSKRFFKGFAIGFGFHITISFILYWGIYYSRLNGLTTCFVCEYIKAIWNSLGLTFSAIWGEFTCPYELRSLPIHLIALSIYWLLSNLTTPLCFGFMIGVVYSDEKKRLVRLAGMFLLLYLPLWIGTSLFLINRWFGYSLNC